MGQRDALAQARPDLCQYLSAEDDELVAEGDVHAENHVGITDPLEAAGFVEVVFVAHLLSLLLRIVLAAVR
jgi:hypothetical protein